MQCRHPVSGNQHKGTNIMQKLILILLTLMPAMCTCGGAPSLPPSTSIPQIKFIKEIVAGTPVAVAVDEEGRIYAAQEDGTIKVMTGGGLPIITLKGADREGEDILKQPAGIAISDKKIFVTDRAIPGVAILSLSGRHLESFGISGGDFKEFKNPSGIYVNDGVIYVADYSSDRVQVFGPNGVFLQSITGPVSEDTSGHIIKEPTGVAVDHRGYVYVTCASPNGTKIFLPNGDLHKKLEDGGNPTAIAMAGDGFYVGDEGSFSIKKYDFKGRLLFSFGSQGDGRTQFGSIAGLCVDTEGKVYVADRERGLVHVFLPQQGKKYAGWERVPPPTSVKWVEDVNVLGGKTVWAGNNTLFAVDTESGLILKITDGYVSQNIRIKDCKPISIALDKARSLWVLDRREKRVLRVDNKGGIRFSFGSSGSMPGQFAKPSDMAITSMGIIFVSDLGNRWVQAFSSDGLLLNVFREGKDGTPFLVPSAIALDDNDVLYVLDSEKRTVTSFSPAGKLLFQFGKKGKGKHEFDEPVGLFATTYEIFILDAGTCSIKVFSPEGDFLREFGARGKGKGDFRKPTAISSMNEKTFLVSDNGNNRIQVLSNIYSPSPPGDTVAESSMHAIRLSWRRSPEPCVSSYHVYRSEGRDGPFTKIAGTDTIEYTDTDVESKKTYYYFVSAVTDKGKESGKGNLASAAPTKYVASGPSGLKAVPRECAVDLIWEPSRESFVIGYVVSREVDGEIKILGTTETPQFSENFLASDRAYTYLVSAVSSDGHKSKPASVTTTTRVLNKPPFEFDIIEMRDVFSNTYEFYEIGGIGRIRLTNHTCDPIPDIKVSFTVNEFMDIPWELEIDELPPSTDREFVLKAAFNKDILNVVEDMQVQTEIKVSYYENNEPHTYKRNHTVSIYEKHRMKWDDKRRFAAFMTPDDPAVLEFSHSVMTQYGDAYDNMQRAAALFDTMGVMGVTYVKDLDKSSQTPLGMRDFMDDIQYPRETLNRKSGDRDDLIALYAAVLESIGIKTLVAGDPGHMLLMFSSGIFDDGSGYTMDGMFVVHEGILWVPVEMSLVGHPFVVAWDEGSRNYNAQQNNGMALLDVRDAWIVFKPPSLPESIPESTLVSRGTIESRFRDEFKTLQKIAVQLRGRKYLDALAEDPEDINALMQIAIIKARAGERQEAFKTLLEVLSQDPRNAGALNNIGNIHFLEGRYEEARDAYKMAVDLEPQDALIWVNLARCCQWLNLLSEARDCFGKAHALNPGVSKRYRAMSLELLGTI